MTLQRLDLDACKSDLQIDDESPLIFSKSIVPDSRLPSELLVPDSRASNFANLSCILVPDLSGTRNLDRVEHALSLPSFW